MAKYSDVLYVFDKGVIVESGTYKELIQNKKTFLNKIDEKL